jgi:monothiol glutaredoxin
MADVIERIESAIRGNKIMVFMKGTPNFPQCGFSAATVGIFQEMGVPFGSADVLADPELRDAIKSYSNWPTIPQVFINGKFVGGCDIIRELKESGELDSMVREALGTGASNQSR